LVFPHLTQNCVHKYGQILGQIWTNPNVGSKMQLKKLQLKVQVEVVGIKFEMTFLTQHLSIFDPNLG